MCAYAFRRHHHHLRLLALNICLLALQWILAGITTTYDDHLIIVGDAAGFIDPLTGAWGSTRFAFQSAGGRAPP